ncbi:hypothetical protein VNI00_001361 [Paramarasmius palmivorus]|uniref:ABM domain-containing protein n=1 Tax=Paramarasmius palmivorus TaxID=297713 RepID=A0AAW0E828_9AGAR
MAHLEIVLVSNFEKQDPPELTGVEGLTRVWAGNQIEDPNYGYYVLEWIGWEARKVLIPSGISTLTLLSPATDINNVFDDAPVSEFAFATLRDPFAREAWLKCLETTLGGMKMTKGAIAGVNGTAKDNDQQYVFVIGWESLDDHKAALSAPYAQDIYNETVRLTEFNAKHARLRRLTL